MSSDFEPIIDDIRKAAEDVVAGVAKEAVDVSKLINNDAYTTKDLILTMTKLIAIAVDGGAKITQKVVGETPTGVKHVAGFSQNVGQRMAKEARLVYNAATSKMDDGDYSVDDWIVTATRLADIAVVGGMEIAETVLIGPGQFENDALSFDLQASESDQSRNFGVVSIKRFGPDDETDIPAGQITLEPPNLEAGVRDFQLRINPKGLPSGVYRGTVQVGDESLPVEVTI
jgi:hypothetical protein